MRVGGGTLYVPGSEYGLVNRCAKTGMLSIEAVVMPPFAQGSFEQTTHILYYHQWNNDQYGHPAGLMLAQEADKLVFYYRPTLHKTEGSRQSTRVELGTLILGRPNHVALICDSKRLLAYVDGKQTSTDAPAVRPDGGDKCTLSCKHLDMWKDA